MIWVVGQHRGGAIDLLGHHQPHQHVWQGQRPQRPGFIGGSQHVGRMAFRSADPESQVATLPAPMLQALRELFGGIGLARHFQGDDVRVLGQGRQHTLAFFLDRTPVSYTHLDVYKRQAKDRAETYAKALDLKVRRIISISEGGGGGFRPVPMMAMSARGKAEMDTAVSPGETEVSVSLDAVSYTHLDVYKRQLIHCGLGMVSRQGFLPVSYTHLDVYKRQPLDIL